MSMEEIVPGYNELRESLLARLEEPLNNYMLAQLKIKQLRARGVSPNTPTVIEQLRKEAYMAKGQIHAIMIEHMPVD